MHLRRLRRRGKDPPTPPCRLVKDPPQCRKLRPRQRPRALRGKQPGFTAAVARVRTVCVSFCAVHTAVRRANKKPRHEENGSKERTGLQLASLRSASQHLNLGMPSRAKSSSTSSLRPRRSRRRIGREGQQQKGRQGRLGCPTPRVNDPVAIPPIPLGTCSAGAPWSSGTCRTSIPTSRADIVDVKAPLLAFTTFAAATALHSTLVAQSCSAAPARTFRQLEHTLQLACV